MKRGALLVAVAALAALLVGCAVQSQPLPVLYPLPAFQLTSQTGQPFDSKSLEGHVWVADFVFTTCPGPCPMMSHQMSEVQRSTAGTPDLKLVSFTVDPAHDTPPVLAEYAKHFKADPGRWFFLTGEQERLNEVGRDGFKLNPVDGNLMHSTRFALIDRKMQIRGYYSTTDDGFMKKLLGDIRQLEGERR
jgi:protein SCO1/2